MNGSSQESRIFASLPEPVQETLIAYGKVVGLSPRDIIEFAIIHLLDLESQLPDNYREDYGSRETLLSELPTFLQQQIELYAQEDETMPLEGAIESALVFFQDPDAMTFDECYPGIRLEAIEQLEAYYFRRQFKRFEGRRDGI